ncbi:MAG: hypothetical protein RJA22_2326 [Verrucomicrobiota bacterium]|jgi:parallel beta-helix repeat protein
MKRPGLLNRILRPPALLGAATAACCLLLGALPAQAVSFRWSASSWRIYIDGPGTASLSDLKAAMPGSALDQVAPGVWFLRANLYVTEGATLNLHGTKIGGDVNELRLLSDNTGESNSFVSITADYGNISIRNTKITSWDRAVNGPDLETASFRRAFIRARSSLGADGTRYESRMDILDSDVGYLGSHDPEAYGLTWKVSEPQDHNIFGNITNLYNMVDVYGDIMRSRLHHNYFGMYSYGSYGMRMVDNEVDHNIAYGFDPHDDSDFLIIENNNVHHNGTHGIIASQRCNNLIIRNNTSWNNVGNGIMLHRYCDRSLVVGNRSLRNLDSGISLFDNYETVVSNNVCLYNFNAGIRCSVGASDNLIINNEFGYGANYGIYLYKGIDAPRPGDDGKCRRNRFVNNYVHHNAGYGIFLTTSDENVWQNNVFDANNAILWFVNGQRNRLEGNSIPRDVTIRTQGNPSLLASTIIRQQPYVPLQLDAYSAAIFEDAGGRVFQPEEPGILTTLTPGGSALTLTAADIIKTSFVNTRNLQATPDAGIALINITVWNTSGDLSKRWLVQAGSSTRRITYRVGDLVPNSPYEILKDGVSSKGDSDSNGFMTFTDSAVRTGVVEFVIRRDI